MKSRFFLVALVFACASRPLMAQVQQATFNFTGTSQTWIVPSGVTSVAVDVRGAKGGSNGSVAGAQGGKGGRVQTTLAVVPGETLVINVGGRGGDLIGPNTAGPGGFNGGGAGGVDNVDFNAPAGGGGGASDVRQGVADLAHRVVVAGGGGGAECCTDANGGDGGDLTSMAGATSGGGSSPGNGGTQFNGGAGGGGCNGSGTSGTLGQGGVGGNGNRAGGGGGGGYFGGGGGGGCLFGSGGGGGSSFSSGTNTIHTPGFQSGDGQVTITFPPSAQTVIVNDPVTQYGIGIQPGSAPCRGTCDLSPSYNPYSVTAPFEISKITFNWATGGGNNCDGFGNYGAIISSTGDATGTLASSTNTVYLGCAGFGGGTSGAGELDFTGQTVPARFFLDFASFDGGIQGGAGTVVFNVKIWQAVTQTSPAPQISSFDPPDGFQGEHIFFFRVKGANFQPGASVSFNGGQSISVDQASLAVFSNEINGKLVVATAAAPNSYTITVMNPDGQADTKQDALTIAVLPLPPVNLTARVGNQSVNLSWNSPQFAPEAYNVYVSLVAADGSITPFAEFPLLHAAALSLTPLNSNIQNGQFYRFAVTSVVAGRESNQSLPVFAKPGNFAFSGPPPHPPHPILFLHGINSDAGTWSVTEDFMHNSLGWLPGGTLQYGCSDQPATVLPKTLNFTQGGDFFDVNFADNLANCSSNGSQGIFRQGDEVGGFIRALQGRGPLSIVSHSMGGLAARAYIQHTLADSSSAANEISDLVMYGTPEKGIDLAYLQKQLAEASTFGTIPILVLAYMNAYQTAVSQGASDMDSDCGSSSSFLSQINAQTLPQGIRYTLIRGHSSYLFLGDHIR